MKKTMMIPLFALSLLMFAGCSSTPCDKFLEYAESECQTCEKQAETADTGEKIGCGLGMMIRIANSDQMKQCDAYTEQLSPEEQEKLKEKMQDKMAKLPCLGKLNKKDKDSE